MNLQWSCKMRHSQWNRHRLTVNSAIILATLVLVRPVAALSGDTTMNFTLSSPAFAHLGAIPTAYTCEGRNLSPPLTWSNLPAGTRSLVLIIDDPDAPDPAAPKITWVHWLLYNIPASQQNLEEGAGSRALPEGVREGVGSGRKRGYAGPCPPIGSHRYFHKLYALDTVLPELASPDRKRLESAMNGHVIGQAVLIGTYRKTKP